jgi:sugar/nucleoside kinase (ribokinase family)
VLSVFGSVALDTTRTPFDTQTRILGGAATYASLSACHFVETSLIGIVGSDFPSEYRSILQTKLDMRGLVTRKGSTFHYDSSFDYDLSHRTTNKTELNVAANFDPILPSDYPNPNHLYLANNDPVQNVRLLSNFLSPKMTMCDTMEYWIRNRREQVIDMMSRVNGVVINDEEARLLCGSANLIKCARIILSYGTEFVIIKKGEHGSLFLKDDVIFPTPGYPLEEVVDPTGAGDSFAGGFLGHIAANSILDSDIMREAVVYGNVMGSFAVEDFGVKRLLSITREDIDSRYKKYLNLVRF